MRSAGAGCFAPPDGHGAGGTYLNFSGQEEAAAAELVQTAYGDNLRRLAEVKNRYDPDNLFRLNNNVTPAR